ncbi:hypothetical protein [Actinomyces ruminicola]|uniref:Uncharacterized protein n=1 Tax=Actinomyces ruminicola TaxID=332524 RepID=A0A1G9RLI4_9ACTO|nr:hypothetical protein [Actinomyces ruminicola]SDM24084.1 hypothetical protein SAMN04487766_10152 [Actinomyces ruminicola]
MTLLVHVVGEADLGVSQWDGCRRLGKEELAAIVTGRREQLAACGSGEQVAWLLGLGPSPAGSNTESFFPEGGARGTLRAELEAAASICDRLGGEAVDDIDLLLIATAHGERATRPIAEAIVSTLQRKGAVPAGLVGGRTVRTLGLCIVDGLRVSRESAESLEAAIGAYDGHVVLAIAGGATTILAEAAGVVAATHGDEWSLLNVGRQGSHESGALVVDMSVHEDPLSGWLMGLGLPTLAADGGTTADKASAAIGRAVGVGSRQSPTVADLALLVQCDAARGDLAVGMALRAWTLAEYSRRLAEHRAQYGLSKEQLPDPKRGMPLGMLIRGIKEKHDRGEELAAPENWLLDHAHLNELGKSMHRLATADQAGTGGNYCASVAGAVGQPPSWLSWPNPRVCILTAHGLPRGCGKGRPSILETLMADDPDRQLRQACDVDGALQLAGFLACSDDSFCHGKQEVEALADALSREPSGAVPWVFDRSATCCMSYGATTTGGGVSPDSVTEQMRDLREQVDKWLGKQPERPRALVVAALGEKPIVIALLAAAQRWGARHGVPVFLMSSVVGGDGREYRQFHQFGLDRDVRHALLDAVTFCLDRLDLRTAARLLALGDPAMETHAESARSLADELAASVPDDGVDQRAGTVLDVLDYVAETIDHVPDDAKARLGTIVGELLAERIKGNRDGTVLAINTGDSKSLKATSEEASTLLRLLIMVRNKLPTTHGSLALQAAVGQVLKNNADPARASCSYADLLTAAVAAVRCEYCGRIVAATWAKEMNELRRAVDELKDSSYGLATAVSRSDS